MKGNFPELHPHTVLGIAAHPDDLDFGASGTLAHFAAQGAAIHYLQLTDGGKGSSDPIITASEVARKRRDEQQAARKAIGGESVTFLDHPDGELTVTLELKTQIVRVIRQLRPDVVITTDPTIIYVAEMGIINHPDHRAAGQAALDAVYPLSRDRLSCPQLLQEGLQPHKVSTVLMTNFTNHNFYIDISADIECKLEAIKAHASQINDYATAKTFFMDMAAELGKKAGYTYAEGFMRIDVAP